MGSPTNAELLALVAELQTVVVELRNENDRLRAQVAELKARVNSNSRNSSKPVSAENVIRRL